MRPAAQQTADMKKVIPQTMPEDGRMRIIERPDGFYWQAREGGREYGPFATLLEAVQDMQAADDGSPEPGETLEEAEAELGIADWVDPDTGALAEEERPHIKDE
jgi:hypothetical protein